MKKEKMIRVDTEFSRDLERIRIEKVKNGTWKSPKLLSTRIITMKLRKLNTWQEDIDRVIRAEFKDVQ